MEFILISDHKLKIILSPQDMKDWEISRQDLQQNSGPAKASCIRLLEQAREDTGFHPRHSKLAVEVYPHEQGGCVLCFTALEGTEFSLQRGGLHPVVFEFDTASALVQGAVGAFTHYSHRIYKSSLFLYRKKYRLVIYPLDYTDRLSVYFLSEYGQKVGEGVELAAFTEEHGRELIRDTALDTLSQYFGPAAP